LEKKSDREIKKPAKEIILNRLEISLTRIFIGCGRLLTLPACTMRLAAFDASTAAFTGFA
jgi:hypothetical protein